MSMTLEQKLRICHEVNMAIASGSNVKVNKMDVIGVVATKCGLIAITKTTHKTNEYDLRFCMAQIMQIYDQDRICVTNTVETAVIYNPVAAETAALKPDLSKSSP